MKKITKEDIKQEVFDLYDDYAHNKIERRQLWKGCPYLRLADLQCHHFLVL